MFRVLKKIRAYYLRLGAARLVKLLFLLLLAKLLARRFLNFSTKLPVQQLTLPDLKHPVHVRTGTTDIEVLQQVLLDHEYEFSLPATPKVIVDAGANIGLASIYFANTYPNAVIVALEPDPSNFKLLEINTARYPQIKPMNVALWNKNKQINLFYSGGGHCGFRTLEENFGALPHCGGVRAVTLDALMQSLGVEFIDVLKVDIEGAEREVFQNSSKWIGQVGVLMVELHDFWQPGCSEAFYAATKGFRPEIIMKGETILRLREAGAS
jgi:FkbM family methyltransferase